MVDQFKEQELSNVVWGFAKLHHYKSDMFRKLLETVSHKLPHFLPQVRCQFRCICARAQHQCFGVMLCCTHTKDSSATSVQLHLQISPSLPWC